MAATGVKRKKSPLDTTLCNRGVWLIKVPNYLSEAWSGSEKGGVVGTMKIKSEGGLPKVEFLLAPKLKKVKLQDQSELELPQNHKVNMLQTSSQCLCTFSEDTSNGKVAAEGKVIQRADILPVASANYMALKKHQIKQAEKTRFTAQHLDKIPTNVYKPKSAHVELADATSKKNELKKTRSDKEVVLDLLFSAFQREQFYTFKNLIEITQQPEGYLKEILRDVCTYHSKQPHKSMWELKPEYRMAAESNPSGSAD